MGQRPNQKPSVIARKKGTTPPDNEQNENGEKNILNTDKFGEFSGKFKFYA